MGIFSRKSEPERATGPAEEWCVIFQVRGSFQGVNGWGQWGPWVMAQSRWTSEDAARRAAQRLEEDDARIGKKGTRWSYATVAEARANGMDRSRPARTVERWRAE